MMKPDDFMTEPDSIMMKQDDFMTEQDGFMMKWGAIMMKMQVKCSNGLTALSRLTGGTVLQKMWISMEFQ